MTNWTTVFLYEFQQQIKRKAFLFTTFGIPLIAALILGGYLIIRDLRSGTEEAAEESITDEFEGENRIGYVDDSGFFDAPEAPFDQFVNLYDSFDEGEAALRDKAITSLYVIEADYFETGSVTQWLRSFNLNALEDDLFEAYLLYSMGEDTSPEVISRLRFPVAQVEEQRIFPGEVEASATDENTNFLQVYVFAILMIVTSYGTSGYLMMSVVSEKENKTVEIILTSVRPFALLLGKILAMGLAGLINVMVWAVSLYFLARQASAQIPDLSTLEVKPETVIIALVYFVLGFMFMGGVFAAIGAVTNSTREGSQLAGWLVLPIMIPMFVLTTFIEDPNGKIPVALSLIPFTAPISMVIRASATDIPLWQLGVSISLLILLAMVSVWFASRMFRVNMLLSGQMPRLRDIPKMIFG